MPGGETSPRGPSKREAIALAGALLVHAALFVVVTESEVQRVFEDRARDPIVIDLVKPTPVPDPDPVPVPVPVPDPVDGRERVPVPRDPPPPPAPTTAPVVDTPPTAPVETAPPTTAPTGESLLRLPKKPDGAIGRVLGSGQPLGPSTAALEGALDVKADGPLSDAQRAARNARRMLESDLADDEVTAGLADDYFRELRNRVETNWRPEMKQLNDGGESVNQIGMMKSFVDDRSAWDEMWRAYLDLAKMYAQGNRPKLEPARIDRLRELMRSRKGAFRFHAISEVVLTQAPDGKVLTVELPLPSGHPGIDDGVRDAISTAVAAMADPPPSRVHHGRSFTSTWRLRATWTMVPPTALLTGAGFDITSKGITVDVPFDIKLKTHVLLLRTDAHARSAGSDDGAEP